MGRAKAKTAIDKVQDKRLNKIERSLRVIVEQKRSESRITLQTITLNPAANQSDQIAVLNTDATGTKIFLKTLKISGVVLHTAASTITEDWRFDVILDKRPTGASATPAIVYGDASPDITALVEFDEQHRFRILKSWRGLLNKTGGPVGRHFGGTIKLNMMQETKVDDSFVIANLTKNHIFIIAWTTATANVPTLSFHFQLIYNDT